MNPNFSGSPKGFFIENLPCQGPDENRGTGHAGTNLNNLINFSPARQNHQPVDLNLDPLAENKLLIK